jgi:hypothetical protein
MKNIRLKRRYFLDLLNNAQLSTPKRILKRGARIFSTTQISSIPTGTSMTTMAKAA